MGPPGSGQGSKIANQIAVAGAVVGLGESLAFADAAGLDARQFLGTFSKGAAGSRSRDFVLEAPCGTSSRTSAWRWRSGTAKRRSMCTVLWPIEGTNFTSAAGNEDDAEVLFLVH
ncbi:hypothetical protein QYE76_022262 [Lolium multiflorum]|uniref:3-hydroxyisobutyrate dehydrogenase-like NAD-binding domain-containing protein n=1 Tax=Lolium multiflorum TaxID=4521 RepID=A0AAD8VTM6_LOLMU|nr:hypothetical protein QYE76_022262 [Lolium multiflorum]